MYVFCGTHDNSVHITHVNWHCTKLTKKCVRNSFITSFNPPWKHLLPHHLCLSHVVSIDCLTKLIWWVIATSNKEFKFYISVRTGITRNEFGTVVIHTGLLQDGHFVLFLFTVMKNTWLWLSWLLKVTNNIICCQRSE